MKLSTSLLVIILNSFLLGGYATATLKFNTPVESYKWFLAIACLLYFLTTIIPHLKTDRKK